MAVIEQTPISNFTGNGVTTVFAFDFLVPLNTDLLVIVDGVTQALGTDYTVAGTGVSSGGTVTFTTAPASGAAVSAVRAIPATRSTDYQENGDLLADVLNEDFDRIVLMVQDATAVVGVRAVRGPVGESLVDLPPAASRANTTLGFDSKGQPTVLTPDSGSAADVLTRLADASDAAKGDALLGVKLAAAGAVARTQHDKNAELISVKDFGAVGDGVTDDTQAIADAHATGRRIFYPYGTYKHTGYFPECEGGIVGEGWSAQYNSSASDQATRIVFYECTDTARAAIEIKDSGERSGSFVIMGVSIEASSWHPGTGCLGYGLRFQNTVFCQNVTFYGFGGDGIICEDAGSPYESVFMDVRSVYNGGHGMVLGTNASVITLIGYQGKWNGAPTFKTAPTVEGTKSGLLTRIVGSVPSPEALTIIGGDCSYNSAYGWDFDALAYSPCVCPGYAEFNLADYVASPESRSEVHVGNDVYFCDIRIGKARKPADPDGFPVSVTQSGIARSFGVRVSMGGKLIWPVIDVAMVTAPTAYDTTSENSGTYQNAPRKVSHLARTDDYASFVRWQANIDPAGADTDKAVEAVLSLIGTGTWRAMLGGPSRGIELSSNAVALPDVYYQKISSGWGSTVLERGIGTAAPLSGTWARGAIVWNSQPSAGGAPGWMCVAGGTPGTWKAMANLAA